MRKLWLTLVATTVGCASVPGLEIDEARRAYDRAVTGPAPVLAPAELADATQALRRAEAAHILDPEAPRARELAYVAQRLAEIAIVRASIAASHETPAPPLPP